jgi:UPF0716 family protein affecting phage T7 exclusion
MKHSTGFALCLAVIVLTAMVTAVTGLLLLKQHDVAALQRRVAELRQENQALRARLESNTLTGHAQAGARENPALP